MWWKEPIRNNNPISQEIPKILGVLCQEPRTKTKYISYCTTPPDRNKPQTRQYMWNNSFQDTGHQEMKDSDPWGGKWKRWAPKLPHSASSFWALVSGAGTEAEPRRLPELTWSYESGETSAARAYRTEYQNEERYTESQRSAEGLPWVSEESDQHKHNGGSKRLEGGA